MTNWILLLIGGTAGTFARYALSIFLSRTVWTNFPYGTLAVNLTGCFLMGLLASLGQEKNFLSQEMRLLLITGFCGAFTTFSTWILETANLMTTGQNARALTNVAVSLGAGFLLFKAGFRFGGLF